MKPKMLGIAALAAVLVVSAAAMAARPDALPEAAADHPNAKALGAERPDAAGHAAAASDDAPDDAGDDVADDAPAHAHGAAPQDNERGQGLLNAIEHVPDHVRAHLQSLWDAMQDGLKGLGDALVKPAKP
ncbi:MAG TPA: hypothetical protein VGR28_11560 [Candidatus Thermoplasmatota archaeon]|jgi:hypothetical protein|nr:hypothetical protein [Candidatus Thermoplasmatota archaeon]